MTTTLEGPAFAARVLTDARFACRAAATLLSRVGRGTAGYCILLLPGDEPVVALSHAGASMRVVPSRAEVLRSRYVDPERVPPGQRDVWVDPVATGFVTPRAAKAAPVTAFMRALGVQRSLRQHVCIGPRLVAGLGHLHAARAPLSARDTAQLDAIGDVWRPILRAHALLAGGHAAHTPARVPATLTARQRQIVLCVAEGLTNDDIGARLHLSPQTIKTVLHRLYARTGARGRVALVRALAGTPLLR